LFQIINSNHVRTSTSPSEERKKNYHAARLNGFSIRLCHSSASDDAFSTFPQFSTPPWATLNVSISVKEFSPNITRRKNKGNPPENNGKQLEFINFVRGATISTKPNRGGIGVFSGNGEHHPKTKKEIQY